MALIKCPECGKDVSELATVCPNCGNPMGKFSQGGAPIGQIIAIIGNILIGVSPLLTYATVNMNLMTTQSSDSYNMWQMMSEEAGGVKSGESAGFFGLIPTAILIIGIVGLLLALIQIAKKKDFIVILRVLAPVLATVCLILFETIGLSTFKEAINVVAAYFRDYEDVISVTRGLGFFALILGIIIDIVSLFVKNRK